MVPLLPLLFASGCSSAVGLDGNKDAPWTLPDDSGTTLEKIDSGDDTATTTPTLPTDDSGGTPPDPDADGDGAPASVDCDDADPDRTPGAAERCDGIDNDCSGAPEVDGDGVCGIWTLVAGGTRWEVGALDPDASPHAPADTIEAAFAIPDVGKVWVLTRHTYHVLIPEDTQWIASGDRDALFPGLTGEEIRVAMAVPASWGDGVVASVLLLVGDEGWSYTYGVDTNTFAWARTDPLTSADWTSRAAPDPTALAAGYLAVDEDAGWASAGSPRATCGADADTLGPYMAFLTGAGRVYLYDAGWCFAFAADFPASAWEPFTLPGAPTASVVAAMDWTGSALVAFAE